MDELSAKERDLLERVSKKAELQPLFFRRVSGLKWFRPLEKAGYFDVSNLPRPTPAKKEGYITIPYWQVLDYLLKCSQEISDGTDDFFGYRISNITVEATSFAKDQEFGNYHAWRIFAEILTNLPSKFLSGDNVEAVDYWLSDNFETSLVSSEIGGKLVPKLLREEAQQAKDVAVGFCDVLFAPHFVVEQFAGGESKEAKLRLDAHDAMEITSELGLALGRVLGRPGVDVFELKLAGLLKELSNDSWSSVWQPSIEDHEQNKHRDDAENLLVRGYREALAGFIETHPEEASTYVDEALASDYETLVRVAIDAIGTNFDLFPTQAAKLANESFFNSNFRHEMWHFLRRCYGKVAPEHQLKLVEIILALQVLDDNDEIRESATFYQRASWLAAIKDLGEDELKLYTEAAAGAGTEPEHPDFTSYSSSGWVSAVSPYSVDEISSWGVPELVQRLESFVPRQGWREPGVEGLSASLQQAFKARPLKYSDDLVAFLELDLAYIHSAIEAYRELWDDKAKLPWNSIWSSLLTFTDTLVASDGFWSEENSQERKDFVANRRWVVSSIARLLEAGCKSDDRSFPEELNVQAETILTALLAREPGEKFTVDSDAVSVAINSPRGRCLEALINLTLRACRLEDKANGGSHNSAWDRFRGHFDSELDRPTLGEYEFATLVTNYLPNFLFISRDWVDENLPRIFNQDDYLHWLCAMQGYSYVGTVFQEIYAFLKDHGDLLKALDDTKLKRRIEDRVVQQIAVAFINDFEPLEGDSSLLRTLLKRNEYEELKQLVRSIWSLRKDDDAKLTRKALQLWPLLLNCADPSSSEGKQLASALSQWAAFINTIDADSAPLLRAVAPFADEQHNSYYLLENLARLSDDQPFEVNAIWQEMLTGTAADYPAEAIQRILSNLAEEGVDGVREAKSTISIYLSKGVERPAKLLSEILEQTE